MTDTLFDLIDVPHLETLAERFDAFEAANPQVGRALEEMASLMVAKGRKRIGIKMLFEVLRWNYYLQTNDPSSNFKLNNSFTAAYSRWLVERHPDWEGLFQMRRSMCDEGER